MIKTQIVTHILAIADEMPHNSAPHANITNRKNSRACTYGTNQELAESRAAEVRDTPSTCSTGSLPGSGFSHQHNSQGQSSPGNATIINLTNGSDSPWDSDAETLSDTSTPGFKRGRHHGDGSRSRSKRRKQAEPTGMRSVPISTGQAVQAIQEEGILCTLPSWTHNRGPSLLILVDAQLKHWPSKDNICDVVFKPGLSIKHWILLIRSGGVQLSHRTVLLYLESTRRWDDIPPLKNNLQALCKVIKSYSNIESPRIFIANHVPRLTASPIKSSIKITNFTQRQAVRSVARVLGHVFELSIYEHLVSSHKERVITPVQQYFTQEGVLLKMGCLIFRECALREAGIKPYWFGDRPDRRDAGRGSTATDQE